MSQQSKSFKLFQPILKGISIVNLEVNTRLASTSPVAGGSRISTLGAAKLPSGLRRKQSKVCSVGCPTTTSLYLLTEPYTNKGSNKSKISSTTCIKLISSQLRDGDIMNITPNVVAVVACEAHTQIWVNCLPNVPGILVTGTIFPGAWEKGSGLARADGTRCSMVVCCIWKKNKKQKHLQDLNRLT